jgi:hypothetical protein
MAVSRMLSMNNPVYTTLSINNDFLIMSLCTHEIEMNNIGKSYELLKWTFSMGRLVFRDDTDLDSRGVFNPS